MIPLNVEKRIREEFEALSPGMKKVGRYLLDHPEDVALLTMREQGRRAGVPAASMTRFAQRLGYSGFDELRGIFAASVRGQVSDFSVRADTLAQQREQMGETDLADTVAHALTRGVAAVTDKRRLSTIVDAATVLSAARRIYCLGHRSCYAPAYHFAYTARLHGADTVLLDAPGGIGADALATASRGDALLAVSFSPYTRRTVETAASARERDMTIVALTDNAVSPLARFASHAVAIPADLEHAAYVTAPIFAAAELLAALVAASTGESGRQQLELHESELARRQTYWIDDNGRAAE